MVGYPTWNGSTGVTSNGYKQSLLTPLPPSLHAITLMAIVSPAMQPTQNGQR